MDSGTPHGHRGRVGEGVRRGSTALDWRTSERLVNLFNPTSITVTRPDDSSSLICFHLVGIVAVHLPELLNCPLGSSDKGEWIAKFLQLCNKELMWPFVGHCIQDKSRQKTLFGVDDDRKNAFKMQPLHNHKFDPFEGLDESYRCKVRTGRQCLFFSRNAGMQKMI